MEQIHKKVLDNGYVELIDTMPAINHELAIVDAARVEKRDYSVPSEMTDADIKLLRYLWGKRKDSDGKLAKKHTSPFEQVVFKFMIQCPIFVARHWMRHRTQSYNEKSMRYEDATKMDIQFYIPDEWRIQSTSNKQGSAGIAGKSLSEKFSELLLAYSTLGYELYEDAVEENIAREMARMFLPVNMYTEFICTINAHNLLHFISLRNTPDAQYEIRVYADAILQILEELMPHTVDLFKEEEYG